jgi:PTH1 family peptidyl-tRNA hydrolase
MGELKLVAGLGNPGREYSDTRHNAGFRVIDLLAAALEIEVRTRRFGGVFGEGEFGGKKLILFKPRQFMNRSGGPVATVVGFYKLGLSDLLVVTDDMALAPGRIRIRSRGSAGGHRGLADVIEKLGTEQVGRLRIGIGQSGEEEAYDYVLDAPLEAERSLVEEAIERAREAVLCWVEYGIEAAMNRFNSHEGSRD